MFYFIHFHFHKPIVSSNTKVYTWISKYRFFPNIPLCTFTGKSVFFYSLFQTMISIKPTLTSSLYKKKDAYLIFYDQIIPVPRQNKRIQILQYNNFKHYKDIILQINYKNMSLFASVQQFDIIYFRKL